MRQRRRKMKTLFSAVLVVALALGFLVVASPGKAEAWHRGPSVGFSVVLPPFGVSIGTPYDYYYPGPVYAAPPYPVYEGAYYWPYYGPYYYGPYYRHHYWGHRTWRGDWGRHGHRMRRY